jgi:hypothetical protein
VAALELDGRPRQMMESPGRHPRHDPAITLTLDGREGRTRIPPTVTAAWIRLNARAMRYALLAIVTATVPACGGSQPRAMSAVEGLPEYTPEEASLFGDDLTPSVFGLPTDLPIDQDPKLGARLRGADGVVKVRVATFSEEELAGKRGYTLALAVEPGILRGVAPESPLEIHLTTGSPSLVQLQTEGSQFVGHRFVLFVKRFSRDGEPELHWHGEGDTSAFERAVAQSNALDELRGKKQTRD